MITASGPPASLATLGSLLVDNCHLVEVVVGQVEMLSGLGLHFLAGIEVRWQLLNFEIILAGNLVSHAPRMRLTHLLGSRLAVMVVAVGNLGVALLRRHLLALLVSVVQTMVPLTHIHIVCVVSSVKRLVVMVLLLTRVDSPSLHISFLPGARPPACDSLHVAYVVTWTSPRLVIWIWIEVITCSGQRWQSTMLLPILERLIDIRQPLVITTSSLAAKSLLPRDDLLGLLLLLLLDVRAVTAARMLFLTLGGHRIIAELILGSVLFLRSQDPFIKKFLVLTGIEGVTLQIPFWLLGDGLKLLLLVDGGVLIVIVRVEHGVASLHTTQVVLGHVVCRVGEPTTKVGSFGVLKILGVVDEVLRLPHIHFV